MKQRAPVRATILAALAIAACVWATIGPAPHQAIPTFVVAR